MCKKYKKHQKALFVSTCANCSCQNVRFFLHFSFLLFCNFQNLRDFLIGNQKSKIIKYQKYQSNKNKKQQQENKMQSKNTSNIMIQNKTRQQAEKQKQNNITGRKEQGK